MVPRALKELSEACYLLSNSATKQSILLFSTKDNGFLGEKQQRLPPWSWSRILSLPPIPREDWELSDYEWTDQKMSASLTCALILLRYVHFEEFKLSGDLQTPVPKPKRSEGRP